jgi:hypothetical protein
MKWDCEEAFSVVVTPRHLAANSAGVSVRWLNDPLGIARSRRRQDAHPCRRRTSLDLGGLYDGDG